MGFKKSGVVEDKVFATKISAKYDQAFYMEPDGSVWVRVFHHNNPANGKLFSSSDSFSTSVYKDADRWFQMSLANKISGTWELMVKQKTTSDAAETKYRWTQKTNPLTGTSYDSVSPSSSNIVRNTSSGYSVNTASGGMYKLNGSSYLVIANATNGNWFGAVGSFSAYSGGIPGFPNTAITSGYLDVYLRIDGLANTTKVSLTKDGILLPDIIEI